MKNPRDRVGSDRARRTARPGTRPADEARTILATILGAKPKDWLAAEVGTAVAQQKLRDQVAFQVEIRRQASLKLQALDALIAELAGAADGELFGAEKRNRDVRVPLRPATSRDQVGPVNDASEDGGASFWTFALPKPREYIRT